MFIFSIVEIRNVLNLSIFEIENLFNLPYLKVSWLVQTIGSKGGLTVGRSR